MDPCRADYNLLLVCSKHGLKHLLSLFAMTNEEIS